MSSFSKIPEKPTIEDARKSIIVALDGVIPDAAIRLAEELKGKVWGFKVNDLFFDPRFEKVLRAFALNNQDWFLDLKLHDIPNTVKNQINRLSWLKLHIAPRLLTVHASGGVEMLNAAREAAEVAFGYDGETELLGVTVLTSLSGNHCKKIWDKNNLEMFERFLSLVFEAQLPGAVCSVYEAKKMEWMLDKMETLPESVPFLVVPGIRPPWYKKKDDQERVTTPYDLFRFHDLASRMVIGRPIVRADSPILAAEQIAEDALRGMQDHQQVHNSLPIKDHSRVESAQEGKIEPIELRQVQMQVQAEQGGGFPSGDLTLVAGGPNSEEADASSSLSHMFFDQALEAGALIFGEFTLKSGRVSPYFFNAGSFDTGGQIRELAELYAKAIYEHFEPDSYIIAGPAYKGIPLAVMVASALDVLWPDYDIGWVFDRKEAKTHGDKGSFVGCEIRDNDSVIIVDDVITTGATKLEFVEKLRGAASNVNIEGLIVALDRQEKDAEGNDPIDVVRDSVSKVFSIASLGQMMAWLKTDPISDSFECLPKLVEYQSRYGLQA